MAGQSGGKEMNMPVKTIFEDEDGKIWELENNCLVSKDAVAESALLSTTEIPEFIEWLQSEYAKHKPEAKANDDGWIEWEGGKCPVEGHVFVDIKLHDGNLYIKTKAHVWSWNDSHIIAYRLSK